MKMKQEDRSSVPQGPATPWGRRIGLESHFSSYQLGMKERWCFGIIHGGGD